MFRIVGAIGALLVGALGSAAAAAPLEAYGQLPNIEQMSISPDGQRLGYVITDGEQRKIVIQNVTDNAVTHLVSAGDVKVRDLTWAGPDHLIIESSDTTTISNAWSGRHEFFVASDFSLAENRIRPLLKDARSALNVIIRSPEVRRVGGRTVLILTGLYQPSEAFVPAVYMVDLNRGSSTMLTFGTENTSDWLVGRDGDPVAQAVRDARTDRGAVMLRAGAGWRTIALPSDATDASLLGFGRDGQSIVVSLNEGEKTVIRELSQGGQWSAPLDDIDTEAGLITDPVSFNLIGTYELHGDEDRYRFFDAQDQKVWRGVTAAYPGQRVQLVSWSDDRRKIVALVDSPERGQAYALVDLDARSARWLGPVYSKLDSPDLAQVTPVRFAAADGLPLTGYLTLPNGKPAKNLPLVVFPHGGPASRDEPGFDWWAQAMASRGYAVLQVNYRGSDGFGDDFLNAGFGQWGRKMQTDLSDGVRYLSKVGVVDPKRVCIVGASYGGYAALAGATLDPDVYRCAVSVAGLSDLKRFGNWSRTWKGLDAQRYWRRFMGVEGGDLSKLAEISPASNVQRVKAPILLLHGNDDTVVPIEQSRIMADALRRAGKPFDFVVLDSTDHWLSRGATRVSMLKATMAFLEKNNPPD